MRTLTEVRESVRNGARLLDSQIPGWAERINIDELDIADSATCIVGQLHLWKDAEGNATEWDSFKFAFNHGIYLMDEPPHRYHLLNTYWIEEIQSRIQEN